MRFASTVASLVLAVVPAASSAEEVLSLHGSGTTNPSKVRRRSSSLVPNLTPPSSPSHVIFSSLDH